MATLHLRPLELKDTDNIVRWRNSPAVRSNLFSQAELTAEQHMNYFRNVVSAGKCAQYIIVVDDGDQQYDIGTTFIKNIDHESRKGEFGIFIGEDQARGKGYAKRAIEEILHIAFTDLDLNRVYLSVLSDNQFAIRAYTGQGFKTEGVLRQDYCRQGYYMDVIIMSILKEEWESTHMAAN